MATPALHSGPRRNFHHVRGHYPAERRIAEEIQRVVWEEVPFVPLGQVFQPQAYRRSLTGILVGGPSLFWNVRRA
jgi:peptide/nickel transport system substrate-binding protein